MKKILFCLLAFYTPVSIVIAQNTTNSPTSMFGLGELSTGEGGQYAGLGGTGIALRGNNFLNSANPASLTELTEQRFQIDAGIMGAYQIYSQRGASNRSVTGNLNNLSIGCRIMPRWYGAIFMAPVSSVGYAITLDEEVAGTNGGTISSLFQGEGGLSKMGISTAYLFGKRFSVGTNLSYVTGTITQTETQGTATEETSSYKHTFYADFGVQYKWAIDRERSFVAGAVYGYSQDFKQDNNLYVSSSSGGDDIEKSLKRYRQCLPQFFGLGASYNTLRWMATIDYKWTGAGCNLPNPMSVLRINTGYQSVEDIHWAMSIVIRSASYWEQVLIIPISSFKRKRQPNIMSVPDLTSDYATIMSSPSD